MHNQIKLSEPQIDALDGSERNCIDWPALRDCLFQPGPINGNTGVLKLLTLQR